MARWWFSRNNLRGAPSSLKASWVLLLKALRSLATASIAGMVGVLVGHDSVAIIVIVTVLAGVLVSGWSYMGEGSRLDSLTSRSRTRGGVRPRLTLGMKDVVSVLAPLPLGVAIIYGISRFGLVIGVRPDVLLGSLSGLLLGLAFTRARLATNLARWGRRRGVDVVCEWSGRGPEGPLYMYRVDAPPAEPVTGREMK